MTDYHNFNRMSNSNDIFKQIGGIIVTDKSDFIDLLEESNIELSPSDKIDDLRLVDIYTEALPESEPLKYGTAYLIQLKNSSSSFDGKVDNEAVYATYDRLVDYWNPQDENESEFAGAIINTAGNVANRVMEGQQKRKYGALDYATEQAKAKALLIQAMIEQKRKQQEEARLDKERLAKTQKTLIVGGSILLGVVILTGIFLNFKAKKK